MFSCAEYEICVRGYFINAASIIPTPYSAISPVELGGCNTTAIIKLRKSVGDPDSEDCPGAEGGFLTYTNTTCGSAKTMLTLSGRFKDWKIKMLGRVFSTTDPANFYTLMTLQASVANGSLVCPGYLAPVGGCSSTTVGLRSTPYVCRVALLTNNHYYVPFFLFRAHVC